MSSNPENSPVVLGTPGRDPYYEGYEEGYYERPITPNNPYEEGTYAYKEFERGFGAGFIDWFAE